MNKLFLFLLFTLIFHAFMVKSQNNPRNLILNWKTDTTKYTVPLNEFTALMKRDGIPPIDTPQFIDRKDAMKSYFEHEPVVAIEINGKAKAYPLSVLMFHEIVNDKLGGIPISATYCPLCNAAIVFDRRLQFKGKSYLFDFGVSGMLRNSDLVMWDRQTESWWQQFTGEALVGKLSGAKLTILSSMLISLSEFFESYPKGLILSTETGQTFEYGTNPYVSYDDTNNKQPRLFKGKVDSRLPAMERVIDVNVKGKSKIYPMSVVGTKQVINDNFENEPIVLFYTSKTVSVLDGKKINKSKQIGSVTVFSSLVKDKVLTFTKTKKGFIDKQTKSVWSITGKCTKGHYKGSELYPMPYGNHFAFSWFAFHPKCEIYEE